MRIIIILVFGLFYASLVQAQVGSSISAEGTTPNDNAMLDVQSPATGDGKGMLIPRVTLAQRTTASSALAGGLLDGSGNLRGGAAQGLIVYQTDGDQGLFFNTSQSATPAWVHLGEGDLDMLGHIITNAIYYGDGRGVTNIPTTAITESDPRWASASNAIVADIATRLASNVWAASGSTTNYLPRTGGTMSGALNMDAQIITNVSHIDFYGDVSVGREAAGGFHGAAMGYSANGMDYGVAMGETANGSTEGAAVGWSAKGYNRGAAMGREANGSGNGAAMGWRANGSGNGVAMGILASGTNYGAAMGCDANGAVTGVAVGASANGYDNGAGVGYQANGNNYGAAVGYGANGSDKGAAMGREANGYYYGVALGYQANGYSNGAAMGYLAIGTNYGAALGREANGNNFGTALGSSANGYDYGIAVGRLAKGTNIGTAVGKSANGSDYGAALGREANGYNVGAAVGCYAKGYNNGVAIGYSAEGTNYGVAIGWDANGAQTNVAIGYQANAGGGTNQIAIGNNVTNDLPNTARIRGNLYLDGGSSIYTNAGVFGSSTWGVKAFTIDHPLDPENKVLRHFCLEGPQVWNVYAGNVQLVNGQAVVELPDYYEALNLVGSEICSLTPWGRANVWVARGVNANTFSIAGDADVKVSWTIKVLRNDPGCLEDLRQRPVEQLKHDISN